MSVIEDKAVDICSQQAFQLLTHFGHREQATACIYARNRFPKVQSNGYSAVLTIGDGYATA
jgi:hypothetical protein